MTFTNFTPVQPEESPARCSERGCPYPATSGQSLCRYHNDALSNEFSPVAPTEQATSEDVFSALFYDKSLQVAKRGIVGIDEWAEDLKFKRLIKNVYSINTNKQRRATGKCLKCGGERTQGRLYCSRCLALDRSRKQKKIARGFCYTCRRPAIPGKKRCRGCLVKELLRGLERQRRWNSLGLCLSCGGGRDRQNRTICIKCEAKKARYRKTLASHRTLNRLCKTCGNKIDPDETRRQCLECRTRINEQRTVWYRKRRQLATCKACGVNPPAAGHSLCASCIANSPRRYKTSASKRHLAWKAAGLCAGCGRARDRDGKLCSRCAEKGRTKARRRNEHLRQLNALASFRAPANKFPLPEGDEIGEKEK